ncbi:MAG: nucleoside-diphosphate sugar epimerase/dehydratase, partial [Myxococcales bacterium]
MIRLFNRTAQFIIDIGLLATAYMFAFAARFEGNIPPEMLRTLIWTLPYVVALEYGVLVWFGVHRVAWRYVALPDVRRAGEALGIAALVLLAVRLVAGRLLLSTPLAGRGIVPMGVTVTSLVFAFLGIVGARVVRRMVSERNESGARTVDRPRVSTLLVGAGRAGALVAKEIAQRPDLGLFPVGFVDDDPVKRGMVIHGIAVLGTTLDLAAIATKRGAEQVLITIATASGKDVRRIVGLCEVAGLAVKIVPGISEIVGGHVNLSRIRSVAIEDLLRREPIVLDEEAILAGVRSRVVLVSGAGGSIGSELCRQIGRFGPQALVLVEHGENSLFHIERELRAKFPELTLLPYVGDIRDRVRMEWIFSAHRPHVVFHAAAHKHVPLMEANPTEAVKNNVVGTKLLAEIADASGVSEFVMISTDKAVNPSSVMGVSKRVAEIVVQAFSQRSKTRFVAVRFGNVLGSAGSVVPIFQEQIARGGPVTVTDPEMKRYFMTIPEACQLVLQAGAMGQGGEIFVLDMGEPVKIVDLARDLIALSGLREDDIEIQFTGVRPGEKLFEELSFAEEGVDKTRHPKVFVGRIRPHPWDEVSVRVAELEDAAQRGDDAAIRGLFRGLVPE